MRKRILGLLTGLLAMTVAMGATAPAMAVASTSTMIDVASYQTGISLPATGVDIAIVKATQGRSYVNPDMRRAVGQARITGMGVAAYDFAVTSVDPVVEANHFISVTRDYIGQGVLPVLDWEPAAPWNTGWALTWLRTVERAYGVRPLIYMNISTENSYDWTQVVAGNYGLWLAGGRYYNTTLTKDQVPPAYWTTRNWKVVAAWQYTSSGIVNGWAGRVDLSVFYGSMAVWNKYARASSSGAAVNPQSYETTSKSTTPTGSASRIAQDVIKGLYGNGSQRRAILGSRYGEVMSVVNKLLAKTTTTAASAYCVTVSSGDTMGAIATRTGRTPASAWSVPSGNVNLIYPGNRVCYKTASTSTTTTHTWIVTTDQTLWLISQSTGVSISRLASLNNISNPNLIHIGQRIRY